jgi:hypothetical protein
VSLRHSCAFQFDGLEFDQVLNQRIHCGMKSNTRSGWGSVRHVSALARERLIVPSVVCTRESQESGSLRLGGRPQRGQRLCASNACRFETRGA